MLPANFIPNIDSNFTHHFEPLTILTKKKRLFFCQGSLDAIVGKINDGILPDFDLISDCNMADKDQVTFQQKNDLEKLQKYGIQVANVKIVDYSHLKEKLISYFMEHVKLDDVWRQNFGKKIYIVLSGFYTNSVVYDKPSTLFQKGFHLTVSTEADDWIMFGFTCLEIKIKRDGTISKIKMLHNK